MRLLKRRLGGEKRQAGLDGTNFNKDHGDENKYVEDRSKTSHSIFTFFSDINSLTEGTYKLKNGKWVKQQ